MRRVARKVGSMLRFLSRPIPERPDFYVLSPVVLPLYGSPAGRAVNGALVRAQSRLTCRPSASGGRSSWSPCRPPGRSIEPLRPPGADRQQGRQVLVPARVDQDYIAGLERTLLARPTGSST